MSVTEKSFDPLDRTLILVEAKDDLDPFSCEDGVLKAQLSCGHVVSAESLTDSCRVQLDEGNYKFKCTVFVDGRLCNQPLPYREVRRLADLTVEEMQYFEENISRLAAADYTDVQTCPKCRTSIERLDLSDLCVECSVCTADQGESYLFCWQCLKPWTGPAPRSDRCANSDCRNYELQLLQTCTLTGLPLLNTSGLSSESCKNGIENGEGSQEKDLYESSDSFTVTKGDFENVNSDCAGAGGGESVKRGYTGVTNANEETNPCFSVPENQKDLAQSLLTMKEDVAKIHSGKNERMDTGQLERVEEANLLDNSLRMCGQGRTGSRGDDDDVKQVERDMKVKRKPLLATYYGLYLPGVQNQKTENQKVPEAKCPETKYSHNTANSGIAESERFEQTPVNSSRSDKESEQREIAGQVEGQLETLPRTEFVKVDTISEGDTEIIKYSPAKRKSGNDEPQNSSDMCSVQTDRNAENVACNIAEGVHCLTISRVKGRDDIAKNASRSSLSNERGNKREKRQDFDRVKGGDASRSRTLLSNIQWEPSAQAGYKSGQASPVKNTGEQRHVSQHFHLGLGESRQNDVQIHPAANRRDAVQLSRSFAPTQSSSSVHGNGTRHYYESETEHRMRSEERSVPSGEWDRGRPGSERFGHMMPKERHSFHGQHQKYQSQDYQLEKFRREMERHERTEKERTDTQNYNYKEKSGMHSLREVVHSQPPVEKPQPCRTPQQCLETAKQKNMRSSRESPQSGRSQRPRSGHGDGFTTDRAIDAPDHKSKEKKSTNYSPPYERSFRKQPYGNTKPEEEITPDSLDEVNNLTPKSTRKRQETLNQVRADVVLDPKTKKKKKTFWNKLFYIPLKRKNSK